MKLFTPLLWLASLQPMLAIDVDFNDPNSIKAGASTVTKGLISYYNGLLPGGVIGKLPGPYYWWEAGAMWGSMVDYYHYTRDSTYNNITLQALQYQVGPKKDYQPPEEQASLGNDDQAFWAMAALRAAETNFPNPRADQPSWLALAQATFNEQVGRWDTRFCGGGLRWQIFPANRGYDLKNTISNGCLFNIAARLARYTGDEMYANWAIKIWDWLWDVGFIDENYNVYDNAEADKGNCTVIDKHQWTYNAATMLMGASTMYNFTNGSTLWQNRTSNLLSTMIFDYFPSGIMKDICEEHSACNVDQKSFKAYLSRWLSASTQMAPFTYPLISPLLLSSARAAMAQCTGAPTGSTCGLKWYLNGTWDGTDGVGQQMAALEVLLGTLVKPVGEGSEAGAQAPLTNMTGGTSVGDPGAGYNGSAEPLGLVGKEPSRGDKVGAWFLTAVFTVVLGWGLVYVGTEAYEGKPQAAVGGGGWLEKGGAIGLPFWKGKEREEVKDVGGLGEVEVVAEPVKARIRIQLNSLDEGTSVVDRRSIASHRGVGPPT